MLEHHGLKFPYYEQTYADGTVCDLTGVLRYGSRGGFLIKYGFMGLVFVENV